MKRVLTRLSAAAVAVLLLAGPVSAKWWIFGQAADEVTIDHVYLNNVSFDEGGPAATFFPDQLRNGQVVIRGKASAGKAKVASVQVSLDNKAKWDKAKISKNGAFEYVFSPKAGKTYDIYVKAIDTRGKTNDVERAYKRVTLSDVDVNTLVVRTLDAMMQAYADKNIQAFMSYVSNDFVPDRALVERAVQRDFSTFDQISMRYTINNVTRDAKGYVAVSITFTRSLTSIRSGRTLSDTGVTQFTFQQDDRGLKVYAMKAPIIFGVSDVENVATGSVNTAANNAATIISVDPATGDIVQGATLGGGAGSGSSVSMTYNNTGPLATYYCQSFTFSDGSTAQEAWNPNPPLNGDFSLHGDNHHLRTAAGVTYLDLGVTSLAAVTSVPTVGYIAATAGNNPFISAGHCYAFKLPGGQYGVIQVISATVPVTTFRYKYSASGPSF